MAKKKQLLKLDYDYDFSLYGILCQLKDYRLCHEINQALRIDLKKIDNLDILLGRQKEKSEFSLYCYQPGDEKFLYVISNRSTRGYLLPEQYQVDYLLMLKGAFRDTEKETIKSLIKSSKIVLGIYEIPLNNLKSKENLIF
jgi:hypothetical protein